MDEKSRKELQQRIASAFLEEPDSTFTKNCKMTVDFLDQVLSNYMVIGYDLDNVPFVISLNLYGVSILIDIKMKKKFVTILFFYIFMII